MLQPSSSWRSLERAGGGEPTAAPLNGDLSDGGAAHDGSTGRSRSRSARIIGGRLLVVYHLAGGDEAAGQQEDDVVAATRAVGRELLPVELVADGEVAAAAALQVALLEAVVARRRLGRALLPCREEEAVVCVWGAAGGGLGFAGGGRGWQRHDVRIVLRVLARRQRGERRCRREEEVAAQAVVRVDGVGGLERDLLLGRGRGHGEVGARGLGDVHGGGRVCECVGARNLGARSERLWAEEGGVLLRQVGRSAWETFFMCREI